MQVHELSVGALPGAHRVVFGGADTSVALRREGWELRDTILVLLPRGLTLRALLVRRPLGRTTLAEQAGTTGTGALNIGAGRLGIGRWPPNVLLVHSAGCGDACEPDCPVSLLDRQSGLLVSGKVKPGYARHANANWNGGWQENSPLSGYGDAGGASRFHPTFRTLEDARRWLDELVQAPAIPAPGPSASPSDEATTPSP